MNRGSTRTVTAQGCADDESLLLELVELALVCVDRTNHSLTAVRGVGVSALLTVKPDRVCIVHGDDELREGTISRAHWLATGIKLRYETITVSHINRIEHLQTRVETVLHRRTWIVERRLSDGVILREEIEDDKVARVRILK